MEREVVLAKEITRNVRLIVSVERILNLVGIG